MGLTLYGNKSIINREFLLCNKYILEHPVPEAVPGAVAMYLSHPGYVVLSSDN